MDRKEEPALRDGKRIAGMVLAIGIFAGPYGYSIGGTAGFLWSLIGGLVVGLGVWGGVGVFKGPGEEAIESGPIKGLIWVSAGTLGLVLFCATVGLGIYLVKVLFGIGLEAFIKNVAGSIKDQLGVAGLSQVVAFVMGITWGFIWHLFWRSLLGGLGLGVAVGLGRGLIGALIGALVGSLRVGLGSGSGSGFAIGLVYYLFGGLGAGGGSVIGLYIGIWDQPKTVWVLAFAFVAGVLFIAFLFSNFYGALYRFDPRGFSFTSDPHMPIAWWDFYCFSLVPVSILGYGGIAPTFLSAKVLFCVEVAVVVGWILVVFTPVIAYLQPPFHKIADPRKKDPITTKLELQEEWYSPGRLKSRGYVARDHEGNYLLQGEWEYFYASGQKSAEGSYRDAFAGGEKGRKGILTDGREGRWMFWHENGQKEEETTYLNGKTEGRDVVWYENGQKYREATYRKNELEGLCVMWHENGQKWLEATFWNGKEEGLYVEWHENGQMKWETTYRNGKVEGLSVFWYENGQKKEEVTCRNDDEVPGTLRRWDEQGRPIP